nr:helix-turn-helix transcriptional regulator [Allomuricauda sp.]
MKSLASGEYFGTTLNSMENDHVKLCITTYDKETHIESHHHENAYLSLLFAGSYWERNAHATQRIEAGEVLFRPHGYDHQNSFEAVEGKCFNIEFKPNWFEIKGNALPSHLLQSKIKANGHPSLYKLLYHLKTGSIHMDVALEYIYDWYGGISVQKPLVGNVRWVKDVTSILQDELSKFHSLQSLSERVFVHPVYLARAFKEKKGRTIGEYQLEIKMNRALQLLLRQNKSVGEVAFETGFYDDSHFIRSFKSYYGLPPSKFKKTLNS